MSLLVARTSLWMICLYFNAAGLWISNIGFSRNQLKVKVTLRTYSGSPNKEQQLANAISKAIPALQKKKMSRNEEGNIEKPVSLWLNR